MYDYSEPGSYFITICTRRRGEVTAPLQYAFGNVDGGVMKLSEAGRIVERCWNDIPQHFGNVRTHAFQIMPNHVHGIIEIRWGVVTTPDAAMSNEIESRGGMVSTPDAAMSNEIESRRGMVTTPDAAMSNEIESRGGVVSTPNAAMSNEIESRGGMVSTPYEITPNEIISGRGEVTSPLQIINEGGISDGVAAPRQKTSLGSVVAYFKYQATKQINQITETPGRKVFQRNYFDHIIRSDRDHFFIARYIELNPLMWHLDSNNPAIHEIPMDEFERTLKEEHGLDDNIVRYIAEYESGYRVWKEYGE